MKTISPDDDSMTLDDKLQQAIQRGQARARERSEHDVRKQMNAEEIRRLHSTHRLHLSEYIEESLKKLPNHLPGFRYETVYGERGWGAACSRDDFSMRNGTRANLFSRIEITVRQQSTFPILEIASKGTVRNKEAMSRTQYQNLDDLDEAALKETIDGWIVQFVEQYTSSSKL